MKPNPPLQHPPLLGAELSAVNVGLESFALSLRDQDVPVVHVDWRPPARGDEQLARILDALT